MFTRQFADSPGNDIFKSSNGEFSTPNMFDGNKGIKVEMVPCTTTLDWAESSFEGVK